MERYGPAARWLHWIMAALVALMFTLGIWMTYFEPKDEAFKFKLYDLHESTGVLIWLLVLLRLANRWTNPPPKLPAVIGPLDRTVARVNHAVLYGLLLIQPVLGFLDTNLWGFPLTWFGVVPLPSPVGKDEAIARVFSALHWWGAMILLVLLALHLAGAAYHGLVRRDGIVQRMA